MSTVNPRMNVTLEPKLAEEINWLAMQTNTSASKVLKELIAEALEKREDRWFSDLADTRDINSKHIKTVSHKDAWQ